MCRFHAMKLGLTRGSSQRILAGASLLGLVRLKNRRDLPGAVGTAREFIDTLPLKRVLHRQGWSEPASAKIRDMQVLGSQLQG